MFHSIESQSLIVDIDYEFELIFCALLLISLCLVGRSDKILLQGSFLLFLIREVVFKVLWLVELAVSTGFVGRF